MTDPLLNGPAAFTFLAIILALSAYLRSISEARSTAIDHIEDQIDPIAKLFPLGATYTNLKLEYLRSSKKILAVVAHGMIFITLMTSIRICAVGYARWLYPDDPECFSTLFRLFDFSFLVAFVLMIIGLWAIHTRGWLFDKRIRKLRKQARASDAAIEATTTT
jgi:hypothetical protein